MKKRFSIYHFLIAVLIISLFTPLSSVFAQSVNGKEHPIGSLTIHKFEQEKGDQTGKGDGSKVDSSDIEGEPLKGVEYTITQTHSYDPDTDTWSSVSNSTSKTRTTNDDGIIVIDDIGLGRYTVQETDWPDNVVGNDEVFTVDIPMTSKDGSSVNYDVHIYPKNEIIRGSATLTKFINDTEETLDGVKFKVFTEDDEPVLDEDDNEIVLETENGIVTISDLPYGNYYFQEIESVDGYLLNGEKVEFTIGEQGAEEAVSLQNYSKPEVEKEVDQSAVNRGEKVTFTITVELPNDISEYEKFVIKDVLHENLEYVDESQSGANGFEFDVDGQTLTWTVTDFNALESGSVVITFDAIVSEDAEANEPIENEAEIDYNNGHEDGGDKTPPTTVTPTAGSLTVKKVDGDSEEGLEGAVFELRQGDDVIATGTSGSNGEVDFDGATDELDYGTYELVETKAPEGYNLLRNPIEVIVNEDHHHAEAIVDNYKSDWELPKTGGIGTTLFTSAGTLLMALALFFFVRRRKDMV